MDDRSVPDVHFDKAEGYSLLERVGRMSIIAALGLVAMVDPRLLRLARLAQDRPA